MLETLLKSLAEKKKISKVRIFTLEKRYFVENISLHVHTCKQYFKRFKTFADTKILLALEH